MSPIYYRPTDASSGHAAAGPAGGHDASALSHGALSAHIFAGGEAATVGTAATVGIGAEHAALMMPPVPGASEPISPLIQLIMRMPGQLGLASSMFEALGNFIMGGLHSLGLDHLVMEMQAHVATALNHASLLPAAEHIGIDPSLLPADAPIFQTMGHGVIGQTFNGNLIAHSEAIGNAQALDVSGSLDLGASQFEGAGSAAAGGAQSSELLSGPGLSDAPLSNHLAGSQRLFSDRFEGSFFAKPGMKAVFAGAGSGMSQAVPTSAATAVPNALNVSGSAFGAQPSALPAVAQMNSGAADAGMNAGSLQTGGSALSSGSLDGSTLSANPSSLGPSGAVADHLGGGKQLLALNHGDSFRPQVGGVQPPGNDYGAGYLQSQPGSAGSAHTNADLSHAAKGLQAKELTLDSLSKTGSPSPSVHKVMDHLGHQSKAGLTQGGHAMDHIAHRSTPHSVAYQHRPAVSSQAPIAGAGRGIPAAPEAHAATTSGVNATDAGTTENGTQAAANATDNPAVASDAPPATYTIRAGDCLWNIAKDHLGSGLRWQEIYKMNQDVLGQNPDLIYSGTDLKLPGGDIAHAGTKAGEYVVKSGDCLWNIAKDQLGDPTKWNELYKANADMIANPRLIFPGQHLSIPGHETAVADASSAAGADQVADAASSAGQSASQATSAAGSTPSATDAGTAAPQGTIDSATGQQIEGGSEMQAPVQQPAPLQPAPVQPAPTQIPGVVGPGAAGAAPGTVSLGPGAAGAATSHLQPLNPGTGDVLRPQPSNTVVNSSIGADLATFLSKRK